MGEITLLDAIDMLAEVYLTELKPVGEDGKPLGPEWNMRRVVSDPLDGIDDAERGRLLMCWRLVLDYAQSTREMLAFVEEKRKERGK